MLSQKEITDRKMELMALMTRGRLSDKDIVERRDEIAKVLDPLPPPWEWQRIRETAGLKSTQMGLKIGVHHMRIRYWERGGGTSHPEVWVDYAVLLIKTVSEAFSGTEATSLVAAMPSRIQDDGVRSLAESLRTSAYSLGIWLDQGTPCSDEDLNALWKQSQDTLAQVRTHSIRLKRMVQALHLSAQQEGRNGNGATR